MPTVNLVRHVNAPVSKVWAFISDIESAPEWVTVMEALVETSDNPVRSGTVYRERSKIGPNVSETEWKVTRFEPESAQVHECRESDFQAELLMQVHSENGGTKLEYRVDYRLMPVFRPLGWLLELLFARRLMRRKLAATLDNVKRLVEQTADSVGSREVTQ